MFYISFKPIKTFWWLYYCEQSLNWILYPSVRQSPIFPPKNILWIMWCKCTYLIYIKVTPKCVLSGNTRIDKLSVYAGNTYSVDQYTFLRELWLYKVFIAVLNKPGCKTLLIDFWKQFAQCWAIPVAKQILTPNLKQVLFKNIFV